MNADLPCNHANAVKLAHVFHLREAKISCDTGESEKGRVTWLVGNVEVKVILDRKGGRFGAWEDTSARFRWQGRTWKVDPT